MLRVLFSFLLAFGSGKAFAFDPNFSAQYPMVQLPSSGDTIPLSVLVPRRQTFEFKAVPVNVPGGKQLRGAPTLATVENASDFPEPNRLLEKVLRIQFTGLKPGTWYRIDMYEKRRPTEKGVLVESRFARTLDPKAEDLHFILGSCMSDEKRYAEVAKDIWSSVWKQAPDLLVMTGDLVYVDAFDYTSREEVSDSVVWQRFFQTFSTLPLYRAVTLIPLFATPDDHDAGLNDSHSRTTVLPEAMRAFRAFYVGPDLPGVHESNPDDKKGLARVFSNAGQRIFLLDNRTYRLKTEESARSRFGHLGQKQESWLLHQLQTDHRPSYVFSGDQWTAPAIVQNERRLNESFYGDHPGEFGPLMRSIWQSGTTVVLGSGDVHFSEITLLGPQFINTPDFAPYETIEITASPMHSIVFPPKRGEPVLWPRRTRITPDIKTYSYFSIRSEAVGSAIHVGATMCGQQGNPLTAYHCVVDRDTTLENSLGRRKFRHLDFKIHEGNKVRVAGFDKDLTLADTNDGTRIANRVDQIRILENRAEKIADLVAQGMLVMVGSNQAGVRYKILTVKQADDIVRVTIEKIEAEHPGAKFHYYDFAEYEDEDVMRKPSPGIFRRLEIELSMLGLTIDWDHSFYVGDSGGRKGDFSDTDLGCAEEVANVTRSKFRFIHASQFFGD